MLRYELKKIFGRTGGKIALLVLAIGLAVICYSATLQVSYTDENGDSHTGPTAARDLRDAKNEWAGPIDQAMITRAIDVNQQIISSADYNSTDIQRQNAAYHDTQGYATIRSLIAQTYGGFNEYDYYRLDTLTPDEAGQLYDLRVQNLKEWLARPDISFSPAEENFLVSQYEDMETPLYYEYNDGWDTLIYYAPTLVMFLLFVIIFLVSGIFPSEHRLKANAIFFSTKLGRGKAVRAKLLSGLVTTTVIYWAAIAVYTIVGLALLGTGGAGDAFQLLKWKAFYNLTIGQAYALSVLGGYIGVIFLALLAMLMSALTRSQVVAVIVPYVLVLAANFAQSILSSWEVLPQILGLLPDQLLQLSVVLDDFNPYTVFGHVTGSVPLLFLLYSALSLALIPLIYRIYRKSQVR